MDILLQKFLQKDVHMDILLHRDLFWAMSGHAPVVQFDMRSESFQAWPKVVLSTGLRAHMCSMSRCYCNPLQPLSW